MSINNREDANKYYQLINNLVDDYIDGHKIRPSKLRSYLKPGGQRFNKFLERNKLKDIKGAEVILKDVIEDREHMEKDGVLAFESFNLLESAEWKVANLKQCLYKGVDNSDLNSEKAIADYFDINLGSIDVIDSGKHKFKIEDWKNDDWICVIYSKEELDVIKTNLIEHLYDELEKKEFELIEDIKLNLSQLIKKETFEDKVSEILNDKKLKEIISKCLGDDWLYEGNVRDYYIWIS
jgi:hypothetical protein